MKKRLGPKEWIFPMPTALVVGGTTQGADVMTAAWINIVSSTPPTLAVGIRSSRHTLELIRTTRAFTVNIPDTSLVAEADYCGTTTGRQTDKFATTGLTLVAGSAVEGAIIRECPFNLECALVNEVDVGSYVVVFGEILETHADEDVLDDAGEVIDLEALDPLVYCAGVREYRHVGPKVADAYEVGKKRFGEG